MTLSVFLRNARSCFFALAFVAFGRSQILQNRPELCGNPGRAVPLPEGTVFETADGLPANFTLKLKDGGSKTVVLRIASSVLQVCPIAGDRLLVFGYVGRDGPWVTILSRIDGREIDTIASRNPMVSPDQHWLIYRDFYPASATLVDEAYLLYDLTKDEAGNRPPKLDRRLPRSNGRQVYPVTTDHFAGRSDEMPEPAHGFVSDSFYWSPDSRFVAFGDGTPANPKSIILVKVGEADLTTYVHTVKEGEICASRGDLRGVLRGATLHNVEFFSAKAPLPDVWATFSGIRCDEPLRLHSEDFKKADIEVHRKYPTPKK